MKYVMTLILAAAFMASASTATAGSTAYSAESLMRCAGAPSVIVLEACRATDVTIKRGKRGPIARAAYFLYQAECRQTLNGYPVGNDWEVSGADQAITNNYGGYTNTWYWGYYNKRSDIEIRQDVIFNRSGSTATAQTNRQVIMICRDDNRSGQISSSEDWWSVIAAY